MRWQLLPRRSCRFRKPTQWQPCPVHRVSSWSTASELPVQHDLAHPKLYRRRRRLCGDRAARLTEVRLRDVYHNREPPQCVCGSPSDQGVSSIEPDCSGGAADGGAEILCGLVAARGNGAELLEPAAEVFDPAARFVALPVEIAR